ncbi:MAG: flavin reductase [Saccharofermentanales bacterium]
MEKLDNFIKKTIAPSTLLNPVPVVMISCCGTSDGFEKNNIITLAWAGTVNSEPPMLSVSIRKSRYSHTQIVQSGEFVVNLVHHGLLTACDYCGVKSGRDVDKFAACELTAIKAEGLEHTCAIAESLISISCIVRQRIELGSHDMFIAEIVAVSVAENLYDYKGKIKINDAGLIAYSHGEYFSLKGPEGFFGFSVAKPEVLSRRMAKTGIAIKKTAKPAEKKKTYPKAKDEKVEEKSQEKRQEKKPTAKPKRKRY